MPALDHPMKCAASMAIEKKIVVGKVLEKDSLILLKVKPKSLSGVLDKTVVEKTIIAELSNA